MTGRPSPRHIRVFLSSPGDVPSERKLALDVLDQLPYDPLLRGKITIEVIAWDKKGAGTPMLATLTPQEAINLGLPKPSECDIVIVILWSRLGTPLPEDCVKPDSYQYVTGTKWPDWRYLSGTEWEYNDAMQAAERLGSPLTLIYRRSEPPLITMTDPEFDAKREQWQHVEAFFKSFYNPDGSIRHGYNSYATPNEFRSQFEHHIRELVRRLLETSKTSPVTAGAEPPIWKGSPFPGLRPFGPDDAPIFFGRGRETDALVDKVRDSRFVMVVGASGSGKSSLVGAGLIPRLKGNAISGEHIGSKDWHVVTFTPGEAKGDPFQALADALVHTFPSLIPSPLEAVRLKDQFVADLKRNPAALADTCSAALAQEPPWSEVLLFVDQFEELFTLVTDEALRAGFVDLLDAAARADRLRIVATMRADFYHACLKYKALEERLRTGSFPLGAPGPIALYEMITRPAARAGLALEDGLPERILDDTGDEPGSLALMAYTLDELYRACCDSRDGLLSHAAYDALGGVARAIGTRAESAFDDLPGNEAEKEQTLHRVFHEMVEVNEQGTATRRRAPKARLLEIEGAGTLIDYFAGPEVRLLVTSGDDAHAEVEVAHEALLRSWPRLANWIANTKDDHSLLRQMRIAAAQWHANDEQDAFRWPDERLRPVYQTIENLGLERVNDLSPVEQDFIRPEFDLLLEELDDPNTTHQRRNIIGERLDVLGDGGQGTGRRGVGLRADGLPDIVWCPVPAGKATLEEFAGSFHVEAFYIARYPITYAQFQAFLDAPDGFADDTWWADLHDAYRKQEITFPRFSGRNRPRDGVSWYQANAFCKWLTARLPQDGWPDLPEIHSSPASGLRQRLLRIGPQNTDRWEIRLPTEWEWQQAATGGDRSREYPWGTWDGRFANTLECGLSRITAVGMYPAGASPVGSLDMSGNVWELCLNEHTHPKNTGTGGGETRVMRGGSYGTNQDLARSTSRYGDYPSDRSSSRGFRVVCASPIS